MSKNTDFGKIAIQQKKGLKGPYLEKPEMMMMMMMMITNRLDVA